MSTAITLVNLFQSARSGERQLPLGSLYVRAALEARGIEVDLRDSQFLEPGDFADPDRLVRCLGETHRVVGLSLMIDVLPLGLAVARRLVEQNPEVSVILGGPGPTAHAAELVAAFPWITAVVRNEGEHTLPELLDALDGGDLSTVLGIDAVVDGQLVHTPDRPLECALDRLPTPRVDDLPLAQYAYYTSISSRGCPYGCRFCSVQSRTQRIVRTRSVECVLDELARVQQSAGVRYVAFQDDIFLLDRKRVRAFITGIQERQLQLSWAAFGRVDGVDADWLDELVAGGLTHITYGIESGADAVLSSMNKGFTVQRAMATLEASASRVLTTGYFIWGYPEESLEDFMGTFQAVHHTRYLGARAFVGHLIPLAGSPVTREFDGELEWHEAYPFSRVVQPPSHPELRQMVLDHPEVFSAFYCFPTADREAKWELAGGV